MTSEPSKLRVLIVDDEPLARSNVALLLRANADFEVVGEYGTALQGLEAMRREHPDLVFLDVRMPEYDGFDILEMLGSEAPPSVIFVTAYDEYALKAFEAGALDYLLKPFGNARFARALERAKERIAARKGLPARVERIAVKTAGRVTFLNVDEIDWIEASDYYVSLHLAGKTHLLRRSMNDMESDLDPARFCRIHRSTIVNLGRVQELRFDGEGEYELLLLDGTRLRMSRRYRKELEQALAPGVRLQGQSPGL